MTQLLIITHLSEGSQKIPSGNVMILICYIAISPTSFHLCVFYDQVENRGGLQLNTPSMPGQS